MAFSGYRENIYRSLSLLFLDLLAADSLETEALGNLQVNWFLQVSLKKKEFSAILGLSLHFWI